MLMAVIFGMGLMVILEQKLGLPMSFLHNTVQDITAPNYWSVKLR